MNTKLLAFLVITTLGTAYLVYLFVRAIIVPYIQKKRYIKQEEGYIKRGLKPFFYEHGRVKIFAHTQPQADFKYKEMKRQLKAATKKNKKAN